MIECISKSALGLAKFRVDQANIADLRPSC